MKRQKKMISMFFKKKKDKNKAPKPVYNIENCYVIFAENDLPLGRSLTQSRSKYCKEHQGDLCIFSANIITEKYGKIWYGDINIHEDFDNLKNIADILNTNLYILLEADARFGNENKPIDELIKLSKVTIFSSAHKVALT